MERRVLLPVYYLMGHHMPQGETNETKQMRGNKSDNAISAVVLDMIYICTKPWRSCTPGQRQAGQGSWPGEPRLVCRCAGRWWWCAGGVSGTGDVRGGGMRVGVEGVGLCGLEVCSRGGERTASQDGACVLSV